MASRLEAGAEDSSASSSVQSKKIGNAIGLNRMRSKKIALKLYNNIKDPNLNVWPRLPPKKIQWIPKIIKAKHETKQRRSYLSRRLKANCPVSAASCSSAS